MCLVASCLPSYQPHPYLPCQTRWATESGRAYDEASHLPQSISNLINRELLHQTLQQEVLHAERIDCSHTSTGWYAKGKHCEISTLSAHRFAGSPMAVTHDYKRTHLVQRRSARRQPGPSYPNGTKGKTGNVPAPGRYRLQRDRGRLPFILSDRI